MHRAKLAHHFEDSLFEFRHAAEIPRMQKLPTSSRKKTVGVQNILLDIQRGVAPLEITGAIPADSMPQYQILRASGRSNGIRLNKTKASHCSFQCCRREERLSDR